MRRKFTVRISEESEINLTPMIDIVFIMLIFFIVTTSFVKESGIKVNTPNASTSKVQKNANIIVAVKSNGEIWVDKQEIELQNLSAAIKRLVANSSKAAVIVKADKNTLTGITVKVIDQIRMAGILNVSIATVR
jgi:biopolymer transport protein ExbD